LLSRIAFDLESERMREVAWRWMSGVGQTSIDSDFYGGQASSTVNPSPTSSHSGSTSDGSGLPAVLACFQRHPDVRLSLFPVIDHFCRAHWSLFFAQVLPTIMPAPRDLFSFVHELLPAMRGSNGVASALASDGVVDWLLDQVVQIINSASISVCSAFVPAFFSNFLISLHRCHVWSKCWRRRHL
jgi:hypothetical protein